MSAMEAIVETYVYLQMLMLLLSCLLLLLLSSSSSMAVVVTPLFQPLSLSRPNFVNESRGKMGTKMLLNTA